MPSDLVSRVNLDALYPPFLELALEVLALCRSRGHDYYAISGFRSPADQERLYQKGRDPKTGAVVKPKEVVTRARFSAHCAGVAIDVVADADLDKALLQPNWKPAAYKPLAEACAELGLESGATWASFRDYGHVQLPLGSRNITLTSLRGLNAKGGVPVMWGFLDRNGPWSTR